MAGIAHLGLAIAGKPIASKIPLFIYLIAGEFLDLIWVIFWLTGVENLGGAPWSHGLFMSIIWSIFSGALIFLIFRDIRSGIVIGTVVFSHWILDFVTHPMGAVISGKPLPPDLFVFFDGSPQLGLGLYNYSAIVAYLTEFIIVGIGLLVYLTFKFSKKKSPQLINSK